MRRSSRVATFVLLLVSSACGAGPTEKDIQDSLTEELRSVAGDWRGTSTGTNAITLEFRLQEGTDGQVTGTGTMKEALAASAVPITVSGTFTRPALVLTFTGLQYEGQQVTGAVQANYTTVGGISTNLQMTGPGYAKGIVILLQEQ
ncbi:MAG: hypothetical protein V4617_03290 [Gemmatimonadota bacterium]